MLGLTKLAMAYTKQQVEDIFNEVIDRISNGESLNKILQDKNKPRRCTFYEWLEKDEEKANKYARACNTRAEVIFDEILEISEHTEEDHTAFTGINVIQRDKLRIDARKWVLAKMMPKKYGDKAEIDHKSSDGSMTPAPTILVNSDATKKGLDELING